MCRLNYSCNPRVWRPGAYLLVENLTELTGSPNPTEDGERLWLFLAAGGHAVVPDGVPFQTDTTAQCKEGAGAIWREPHLVTVSGDGFSATALPSQAATFTVPSGVHAGDYQLDNVNWSAVGTTPYYRSLSITAAPERPAASWRCSGLAAASGT